MINVMNAQTKVHELLQDNQDFVLAKMISANPYILYKYIYQAQYEAKIVSHHV